LAYLVFDLGTSGGKSAVVGEDGRVLASKKENWAAKMSPALEAAGREFDSSEVRSKLIDGARSALKASGLRPDQVTTISSTSIRFGYVFLDKDDNILYFGSNMDGRGFFEQGAFVEVAGDQTHEVTGLYPPMLFSIPKLLWFKENAPSVYQRVAKIMNVHDWWLYTLSGGFLTDRSSASTTGLFDIKKSRWSQELMGAFGLDPSLLPEVAESGKVMGDLSGEFRTQLGLGRAAVVTGGPDTQIGLLGTGCAVPGETGMVAGATNPCQQVVDSLPPTLGKKLLVGAYVLPGTFVVEANAGSSGLVYDWAVKLYAGSADDPYGRAAELISRAPNGPTGIISMLGAQIMVSEKIFVLKPAVSVFPSPMMGGMELADPGAFLKGVIEELCYAAACNLDEVEQYTGNRAARLKLTGGLVRNKEFLSILSSTTGKDVLPSLNHDGTMVGVALCCMVGSGRYPNLLEACRKTELVGPPVKPAETSQDYQEQKGRWRDLYYKMLALAEEGAL